MKGLKHSAGKIGLNSKLLLILGVIVLLFVTVKLVRSWQKAQGINQEISALEQEIINLENDNLQLSELIKYLNSTAYIEEKARTDLGLKKAGEKTIIIPEPKTTISPEASSADDAEAKQTSNLIKWWRYLFAKK